MSNIIEVAAQIHIYDLGQSSMVYSPTDPIQSFRTSSSRTISKRVSTKVRFKDRLQDEPYCSLNYSVFDGGYRKLPFLPASSRKDSAFADQLTARPPEFQNHEATLRFTHVKACALAHLAIRDFVNRIRTLDFSYALYSSYTAAGALLWRNSPPLVKRQSLPDTQLIFWDVTLKNHLSLGIGMTVSTRVIGEMYRSQFSITQSAVFS